MKVLIIRFSSIGDIVLTSPIVRCIKKQLDTEVHYLTKKKYASLLSSNPYIDTLHFLEDKNQDDLRSQNYDLVIDLHKNLRTLRLRPLLGGQYISFNKANIKKWLMVNFHTKSFSVPHLVDRYFLSLKAIQVKDDGRGLDFFIDPDIADRTMQSIPDLNYSVIVLGANYYTKRIPTVICEKIISETSGHFILIGGNDTIESGEFLNKKYPEKVINLAGKINLQESAAVIKNADTVITGDTGMMHIAAAFQKKIFVLWGNTTKELGMYPYYGHRNTDQAVHLEVQNLSCRPCSKLGYEKCPRKHFNCMLAQDISIINR